MDKYIYDENNSLWYELQEDYYIPYLTSRKGTTYWLKEQRHLRYLKEYHKITYEMIFTNGKDQFILPTSTNRHRNALKN